MRSLFPLMLICGYSMVHFVNAEAMSLRPKRTVVGNIKPIYRRFPDLQFRRVNGAMVEPKSIDHFMTILVFNNIRNQKGTDFINKLQQITYDMKNRGLSFEVVYVELGEPDDVGFNVFIQQLPDYWLYVPFEDEDREHLAAHFDLDKNLQAPLYQAGKIKEADIQHDVEEYINGGKTVWEIYDYWMSLV